VFAALGDLQCSSAPVVLLHSSCRRAISIETPIIHIRPFFHVTTPLLSAGGPFQLSFSAVTNDLEWPLQPFHLSYCQLC